jgi:hypothetical protein
LLFLILSMEYILFYYYYPLNDLKILYFLKINEISNLQKIR